MSKTFLAYRIHDTDQGPRGRVEEISLTDLNSGDVTIRVRYSSINYKDALAGTGRGKILKRYPLVGGIDAAGVVSDRGSSNLQVGQPVLVTGCGLSETQDGGYAEYLRAPASAVVPLPEGLSLSEAMTLGTAGFTAALALMRMEQNGQTPALGPIVVTGASGGVGSIAVSILSQAGYDVWAVSGKVERKNWLRDLGAQKVLTPSELALGSRPLESVKFGGAIDNVGGELLAGILRHVELWGNVASIGLAESPSLQTTVMPFILRGVSLLGASSNNCPGPMRQEIWRRLAQTWKPRNLMNILSGEKTLMELDRAFSDVLARKVHGRLLVRLAGEET